MTSPLVQAHYPGLCYNSPQSSEVSVANKNDAPDLVIKPAETDEEMRLANDLMAKSHCADYFEGVEWLETCGVGYPNFLREHTRIALRNGDLAGALRITTETVRVGEARLRMGGLGWVTTVPRHRHRGVAYALIDNTLGYMQRHGYHVSMLFGIPNFYHRFGFVTALAEYAIVVAASEAAVASRAPFKVRPAKPGDIRAIQKIHNANDTGVACSLLRTAAHITNKWDRWSEGLKVLTTEQGKVVAYVNAHRGQDELTVIDLGVAETAFQPRGASAAQVFTASTKVCSGLLATCAELAAGEAVGRIRFQIPPPHPFARFLLKYTSTHEMRIVRDSGGMMAFVDLGEALESMIPEWESLLARSAVRKYRTEFTLFVDNKSYRVRANCGAIDIAPASGKNKVGLSTAQLMHMITGYRHVEDILTARRRIITPEARALLAVLFPKRHPYVWHFDRF